MIYIVIMISDVQKLLQLSNRIAVEHTGARFLVNFRFQNCEIKDIYPQEAEMY